MEREHITRNHLFEDRLDLVERTQGTYRLFHERTQWPVSLPATPELDAAFAARDWNVFESAEAGYFGGEA